MLTFRNCTPSGCASPHASPYAAATSQQQSNAPASPVAQDRQQAVRERLYQQTPLQLAQLLHQANLAELHVGRKPLPPKQMQAAVHQAQQQYERQRMEGLPVLGHVTLIQTLNHRFGFEAMTPIVNRLFHTLRQTGFRALKQQEASLKDNEQTLTQKSANTKLDLMA